MPKLTDTQLVILSTAASRRDGAVLPLPKSLKAPTDAITAALKGLLKTGLVKERQAASEGEHWRKERDQRFALIITDNGAKALEDGSGDHKPPKQSNAKAGRKNAKAAPAKVSNKVNTQRAAPAQGTKQALLIDLLKRKGGATIKEAIRATGWQAHSVRGAISGTLKKKLRLTVKSESVDGRGRVYRIAGGR